MVKITRGSLIQIINPHIFRRCGYELTLKSEIERITKDHTNDVLELAHKILNINTNKTQLTPNFLKSIICKLAYVTLSQSKFGGPERSIYTEHIPELEGMIGEVIEITTVVTGIYSPARSSYTYDGDYDYEPATLENQKRHKILRVKYEGSLIINGNAQLGKYYFNNHDADKVFWIEQANVQNLVPEIID